MFKVSKLSRMQKRIVLGIGAGLVSSAVMMFPFYRNSEAAIAVIDIQNIEEAIKTAITTASILDESQKQLALQILNMKKLDAQMLFNYAKANENAEQALSEHNNGLEGIMKANTGPKTWLHNQIGSVENILNGNVTLYDIYKEQDKVKKSQEKVIKDMVKTQMVSEEKIQAEINHQKELGEDSSKAEGELQALQVSNAIALSNARINAWNANSIGSFVGAMGVKEQAALVKEAQDEFYRQREIEASKARRQEIKEAMEKEEAERKAKK